MTQTTNNPVQILQKIQSAKPNVEGIQHPQELFAQLQRLTKAGIWTIDLATMQILVSEEMYRLHGVPIGATVYYEEFLEKMCVPEDQKISENARIKVITQKVEVQFDYRAIDQTTGETKWFSAHVAPLLNAHNEVIALFGTTQDITDRQRQEYQKIQDRLASMGEMLNLLAHHWRQPLSTISVVASKLEVHNQLNNQGDSYLNENLKEIQRLSQHLSNTINEVRQVFSDVRRPRKSMDLVNIIQALIADVQKRLETSSIRCVFANEGLTTITTQHGNFIRSICKELIQNAIEALEDRQDKLLRVLNIRISERGSGGYLIKVEDNAGGIDEGSLTKIFEPYYTTKMDRNGTGLGLYMSRMLAILHLQGSLEAENTSGGACFKLYLPQLIDLVDKVSDKDQAT
ncbi:MAG: PAS domain S-box protein [Deltaproteobacteria bacterium]|nr:PAS domain S-box protein [Deltaproteobacteria bacterium]MBT7205005.1 PAS domain S-box protein [Deltaproteobacteria bacterium]